MPSEIGATLFSQAKQLANKENKTYYIAEKTSMIKFITDTPGEGDNVLMSVRPDWSKVGDMIKGSARIEDLM